MAHHVDIPNPQYHVAGVTSASYWTDSRERYEEYTITAIQRGDSGSYYSEPDRGVQLTIYVAANGDLTTDVGKYEETHS